MDTIPGNDSMENPPPPPLAGLDPADLLRQGAAEDTLADGPAAPFHPPSVDELAPLFPRFEILELIGQGGMGAVYKVRQKDLDRIVALKILPPAIGGTPGFSERFTREAKALARLNHPGIVTLHEFGQAEGLHFILMEFVDGVNLAQLMKSGRISPREALAIVPQICDALQFAHDQGIVHRDIKPENILLDRLGRVKVADFGIAKVVASVCDRPAPDDGRWSQTDATLAGKIIGTPQYMAPEQIDHPSDVDHRADIYALGVVLYQMLTGELPGKELQAPLRKVHLDVRLDEIVLRAMEKEPEKRYQTALEFRTVLDGMPTSSPQQLPVQKREAMRRWWWMFLVIISIGILTGLAAGSLVAYITPKKYESEEMIRLISDDADGKPVSPAALGFHMGKIKSKEMRMAVVRELDLANKLKVPEHLAVSMLNGVVNVESIRDTDQIGIRVRYSNAQDAADIASAFARNYRPGTGLKTVVYGSAQVLTFPAAPNVPLILILGGLGGFFLSLLLSLAVIPLLHKLFPEKKSESPDQQEGEMKTRVEQVQSPGVDVDEKKRSPGRMIAIGCGVVALAGVLLIGALALATVFSSGSGKQVEKGTGRPATAWSAGAEAALPPEKAVVTTTNSPAFGPLIERVIPVPAQGVPCVLDLESGEFLTPPDDLAEKLDPNTEKSGLNRSARAWLRDSRADITGFPDRPETIGFLGAAATTYSNPKYGKGDAPLGFDDYTPEILATVSSDFKPTNPSLYSTVTLSDLPGAIVFITLEGTKGVMQVVGPSTEPAGVKIRYKLLRGVPPMGEALEAAKAAWVPPPLAPCTELPEQELPDEKSRRTFRLTVTPANGNYVLATIREYEGSAIIGEVTPAKRQIFRLLRTLAGTHTEDIFVDSHWVQVPSHRHPGEMTAATDRCIVSGFGQQIAIDGLDFQGQSGASAEIKDQALISLVTRLFKFTDPAGDKRRTRIVQFELQTLRVDQAEVLAQRHKMKLPPENVANWGITLSAPAETIGEVVNVAERPETSAVAEAEAWLAGIDAGNYARSWQFAARFFQKTITEAGWSNSMTKARRPLGKMNSRKLLGAERAKSLPGAPDGEYEVMQFDTSFAAKEKAVETVTFVKEPDGTWKAIGYFIK